MNASERAAELCQTFSKNIRRIRQEKGLSQAEIATAAGISQGSWFQYETGKRIIRLDALIRISIFLQIPILELIYGEPQAELTPETQAILKKYARLDERGKAAMEELLNWELRYSV